MERRRVGGGGPGCGRAGAGVTGTGAGTEVGGIGVVRDDSAGAGSDIGDAAGRRGSPEWVRGPGCLATGTEYRDGRGGSGCAGGIAMYGGESRVGDGSLIYAGLGLGSGLSLSMGWIRRKCTLLRKTKRPEP